jgi:lysophospholipase L1-like esterase
MKESIFDCRPSHLFLMTGTNDVGVQDVPLEYWFGAYKYVVSQARQRYPDMKVIVMTCPPCGEPDARQKTLNARIQEWNRLIREYAKAEGFRLIDLHALLAGTDGRLPPDLTRDGLHFNKAGYDRWAKAAGVILREDGAIPVAPGVKQPAEAPRPSPGH